MRCPADQGIQVRLIDLEIDVDADDLLTGAPREAAKDVLGHLNEEPSVLISLIGQGPGAKLDP